MQCLSVERSLIWSDSVGVLSIRINAIADQWMTDVGHMYADLMGPPRFQCAFDDCGFGKCLRHAKMRDRMLTLGIGQNGHFFTVGR